MILSDPLDRPVANGIGTRATLDELFRWAAIRRPNALALLDPPNRARFTDGQPRHLTYAQADRMISAIAGRLHRMGLRRDAIVGLQFGNTVESVLVLLAVLRAGLIAMPLPLLWRRAEAVAALNRVGANALIVSGRVGAVDHFALAMQFATETFPVRLVCGFGRKPPDGMIGLDDLYDAETLDPLPAPEAKRANLPGPGAHLAVITWDVSPDGAVPVARSHAELVAGGLAVLLEGQIGRDAVILSTLTMASFAGLASALVPWLMAGGTLALHHPFDADTFAAQRNAMICDTIILPGSLAVPFAEAGHLVARNGLKRVVGVWRAPERLPRAPIWPKSELAMIDVQVFGEIGLIAAMRDPNGQVAEIPFGLLPAPRDQGCGHRRRGAAQRQRHRGVARADAAARRVPGRCGAHAIPARQDHAARDDRHRLYLSGRQAFIRHDRKRTAGRRRQRRRLSLRNAQAADPGRSGR